MEMTPEEVRRHNFNQRVEKMGGQSAFIEKTGYNQGQVSQIQNGGRNIGEKLARKLERLAEWPRLSLDQGIGDPVELVETAFLLMSYVDDKERDRMLWHIKNLRDAQAANDSLPPSEN